MRIFTSQQSQRFDALVVLDDIFCEESRQIPIEFERQDTSKQQVISTLRAPIV